MLKKMQFDRLERTFEVLSKINPYIAKEVLDPKRQKNMTKEEKAVIKMQKTYRGYKARKLFSKILYEHYLKLDEEEKKLRDQQVEEGLRALHAKEIEDRIIDEEFISRQRKLRETSSAITIQRRFREHLKNPKRKLKKIEKVDKYAKYKEMLKTPLIFSEGEDSSDHEFESYISKATGININKTKIIAKKKIEEDEKHKEEKKTKKLNNLRAKYKSLIKLIDERSLVLKQLLEERADLMAALDE